MAKTNATKAVIQTVLDNAGPGQLEHGTLLVEYTVIDGRIIREMDADDRFMELNLVALSAVTIASSFVIEQKAYFLFLILTLPFYLLTWSQARRVITIAKLIGYSRLVLAPRLNSIIQQESKAVKEGERPPRFISYEEYVLSDLDSSIWKTFFSQALPQAGKSVLQLTIAILLVVTYLIYKSFDVNYLASAFDVVLIVINGIFIVLSILAMVSAVFIRKTAF